MKVARVAGWRWWQQEAYYGIDLSTSTLRVMRLLARRGNWHVDFYAHVELAPEIFQDGLIVAPDELGRSLRQLLQTDEQPCAMAVAAIARNLVVSRIIDVPVGLSEVDLCSHVEIEAEQHLPFDLSDVYLDYKTLGLRDDRRGINRVVWVACRGQVLDQTIAGLQQGGLSVAAVNVDSFAALHAIAGVAAAAGWMGTAAVLLLDRHGDSVAVLAAGQLVDYMRVAPAAPAPGTRRNEVDPGTWQRSEAPPGYDDDFDEITRLWKTFRTRRPRLPVAIVLVAGSRTHALRSVTLVDALAEQLPCRVIDPLTVLEAAAPLQAALRPEASALWPLVGVAMQRWPR